MGSESVSDESVKRMHREMGAFLQAEVDRGDDKGLIAGIQEERVPEPSGGPVVEDPDEAEERAKAALSGEQPPVGETVWTEHAARRYKQGEISAHQADLESGILPDPANDGLSSPDYGQAEGPPAPNDDRHIQPV